MAERSAKQTRSRSLSRQRASKPKPPTYFLHRNRTRLPRLPPSKVCQRGPHPIRYGPHQKTFRKAVICMVYDISSESRKAIFDFALG